jgi:hypothetical protein
MVTVKSAGIDTWSPSWYVDDGDAADRALQALCTKRSARGQIAPDKLLGHTLGYVPASRLVYLEGHPADAVDRAGQLGHADELPAALVALMESAGDYGVDLPMSSSKFSRSKSVGFAGLRRLDVTADVEFDNGAEGLATLAGIAALLGNRHSVVHRDKGKIETVYLMGRTGRTVLGRWYDKGVESGTAARGTLIRPEAQRRFKVGARRELREIDSLWCRETVRTRFLPLWKASKGVTVAGPLVLGQKIADLYEADRITRRQAELLAGYIICDAAGIPPGSRATGARRRQKLNELGLVAADAAMDSVEVDLNDVLTAVLDADAWNRQG